MAMKEFKPTYLYIKQHSITGLLYFGKTTRPHDKMLKYCGSGDHWTAHIKKHGKEHVITVWYCLFYDQEDCTNFALRYSKQENIVESKQWANYIVENGLTGGKPKGSIAPNKGKKQVRPAWNKGIKMSPMQRANMGAPKGGTRRKWTNEEKLKMSLSRQGRNKGTKLGPASALRKENISKSKLGLVYRKVSCPHCGKEGGINSMNRYHFNNCKENSVRKS